MSSYLKLSILICLCANLQIGICKEVESITYLPDLENCKEYEIVTESGFNDFFLLNNERKNKAENEDLHLEFYVLSSDEAHILLSPNQKPNITDRVYKISLGMANNEYSAVYRYSDSKRRNPYEPAYYAKAETPSIFTIDDVILIKVIQKKDGTIVVYVPSQQREPIFEFTDRTLLHVKYVSFSSPHSAIFYYSCELDDVVEQKPHLTVLIEKLLTIFKITLEAFLLGAPKDLQNEKK